MNKMSVSAVLLGGIVAAMLSIASASAQATRTWVSGVGDDANPCSRTAPCKTFAGAISKTAAGGEINVLDPGGFGGVTITKSITIRSTFEAGVLVSGTNGIIVNAGANDVVILEGLDIEGLGTGIHGVNILAGKTVYVLNCRINNFSQNGIQFASSTNNARLIVKDSTITRNAGGVNVQNGVGVALRAGVLNSLIDGYTNFGLQANGSSSSIAYAHNTIASGTGTGLNQLNGGQIVSYGPSSIVAGGDPNATVGFK